MVDCGDIGGGLVSRLVPRGAGPRSGCLLISPTRTDASAEAAPAQNFRRLGVAFGLRGAEGIASSLAADVSPCAVLSILCVNIVI